MLVIVIFVTLVVVFWGDILVIVIFVMLVLLLFCYVSNCYICYVSSCYFLYLSSSESYVYRISSESQWVHLGVCQWHITQYHGISFFKHPRPLLMCST